MIKGSSKLNFSFHHGFAHPHSADKNIDAPFVSCFYYDIQTLNLSLVPLAGYDLQATTMSLLGRANLPMDPADIDRFENALLYEGFGLFKIQNPVIKNADRHSYRLIGLEGDATLDQKQYVVNVTPHGFTQYDAGMNEVITVDEMLAADGIDELSIVGDTINVENIAQILDRIEQIARSVCVSAKKNIFFCV